ncbi:unnamed protein product [Penicillium salamii]|uniref:Zn(2)-C6 fungal-type domain-containing protein n=1 Tax=Penicillium salamii TaxID=1612424 RepID=A0A9W4NQ13_9EURO|nr:unnamed protein product [Penicillium salamii]CAG8133942.1 unnamed protein product [Penicillium salamii]CAG8156083.1 unnamed protein product [Penicillium salamii]CAG8232853.1 unnamed protein product [Penicillium salamii]CAG8288850.1 unnamed protein product [Penicillium salamii]
MCNLQCDETRPACLICTSSRKLCGGYEIVIDKRSRSWRDYEAADVANSQNEVAPRSHARNLGPSFSVMRLPLTSARTYLTWNERWYLDYYRNCVAVRLANYYDSPFWNRFVLQICDQHPLVCHAAVAVGAYYHQLERVRCGEKVGQESLFALHHSTKAISYLRETLAQESSAPKGYAVGKPSNLHKELVLVTCAIFAFLAFLQGDTLTFRSHLISGYKLFKQWGIDKRSVSGLLLNRLFARIHIHWVFCSDPQLLEKMPEGAQCFLAEYSVIFEDPAVIRKPTPSVFTPIDQLDRVQQLIAYFNGVMLHGTHTDFEIEPAGSLSPGSTAILIKFQHWRTAITEILNESKYIAPENSDYLKLITFWAEMIGIKVAVAQSPDPNEMLFDDHLEQFVRASKMAQELTEPSSNIDKLSPRFYEISLVPVLLWAGAKCRNWLVRRTICNTLRHLAGDHYLVYAINAALSRLILLESDGVKRGDIIPKAARFDSINLKTNREESTVELRYRRPPTSTTIDVHDHWGSDLMHYEPGQEYN